jgi:hypothetical protein
MGLLSLNLPVIGQGSATEDQKIRDGLSSIQTVLNGNLDEANVPNMAAAFTTYKPGIATGRARVSSAAPAGSYAFLLGSSGLNNTLLPGTQPALEDVAIEIDPARFSANARTTRLNLRFRVAPNAVAPGITFTAGLWQIATTGGASGNAPTIATLNGAALTGSTAVVATPGALSLTATASSGDFTCPAAGLYVMGVVTSGTPAAGSVNALTAVLDMHQV